MYQPWLTTTDWPVKAFDGNAAKKAPLAFLFVIGDGERKTARWPASPRSANIRVTAGFADLHGNEAANARARAGSVRGHPCRTACSAWHRRQAALRWRGIRTSSVSRRLT